MSYIHHLENQLEDESQGQEIVTPPEESRRKTDNNDDTVSNDSNSSDRLDSSPKVNNKRASWILTVSSKYWNAIFEWSFLLRSLLHNCFTFNSSPKYLNN